MTSESEATPIPQHTLTLDELFARKASELSTGDLEAIVTALRTQREQWNANQNSGQSRKRVTSKQIPTAVKAPLKSGKQRVPLSLENLLV